MWMKLLEWAKVEEIIVTQGNDYQWSFIAEEVSSTYKVDKMIPPSQGSAATASVQHHQVGPLV